MTKKPSFTGRRKARRYALQALYGWVLSENALSDIETHFLVEHAAEGFDREYFQMLLHEVPRHIEILETTMSPYLSREFADLDPIELTILRISIYELKERLDIPYRVVINEGLELAKAFGSADSHKFVNGVLDKVARELRKTEIQ
ncbi:MAG TPA: transcription antitermination factor NusB [Gammaproteobacteria bacterium]|nr:transcription antitermination factor NusB [Gammaproteobacteria bacterium]